MRIGVVGHRRLSAEGHAFATDVCTDLIGELRARVPRLTAVSALCEGADTLFAEAAVALDVPLEVVAAHTCYREDFAPDGAARSDFERLWSLARRRSAMAWQRPTDRAYQSAMHWVAGRCDLLIAVWDGRPSTNIGGTAHTVRYARAHGRALIVVDPESQRVARG